MSFFRRLMLAGMSEIDIESIPETRKIYYTATEKVTPQDGSLGSTISINKWGSSTGKGVIVCKNDIISIGDRAFQDCSTLTSITIPVSVISIGQEVFTSCNSLDRVYCKAITPPTGGSYMFDGNASDRKIYVPNEAVEAYKSASKWSTYADDIVGYDFE